MCPADREGFDNLLGIEKALLTNKLLAQQWTALTVKTKILDTELTRLQNEYDAIIKECATKIDLVFEKYNISSEKRQEFMKNVLDLDSRETLMDMMLNEKGQ